MPPDRLDGCASGTRVHLWRSFHDSHFKGPMLHFDPGPINPLCGPGENKNAGNKGRLVTKIEDFYTEVQSWVLALFACRI